LNYSLPLSREARWLLLIVLALTAYRAWVLLGSPYTLFVDEAYYWGWARHPDWGYFSKPPMIAWLIAATTSVCGDGVACVKSGALLVYPLTAVAIYLAGQRMFDARIGLWSAGVFLTLPAVSLSSLIISTDVVLFLFWAWALYALHRALETNAARWWVATGIAIGLGLMSKYTMVLFPASAALYLLLSRNRLATFANPRAWLALGLAALIFVPNLVWNVAHDFPTFRHTAEISDLQSAGLHWDELADFATGQFAVFGPVYLLAYAALLATGARRWADDRFRYLACFSLPFLLGIAAQALLGRANANWAAPAYVGASLMVCAWLLIEKRRAWLVIGLTVNLALMPLVYHFESLLSLAGVAMTAKTDPFKRLKGWDALAVQVQAIQAAHPQAILTSEDRTALAHLVYLMQPRPEAVVSWNPGAEIRHQYDLDGDAQAHLGRDLLIVTRLADAAAFAPAFVRLRHLNKLEVAIYPDYGLEYHVFLGEEFKGYAP
jgi:4-amino-4-deoxy-L-arabinose transferase-like glycosyltransferase